MSMFESATGSRCPICKEMLRPGESVRGRHFWLKHNLVGAMIWRWTSDDPGIRDRKTVISLTIEIIVLLFSAVVALRNWFGI